MSRDGWAELCPVGQTWGWAKLGLVKLGLGWVEFGGMVRFGHIGIK